MRTLPSAGAFNDRCLLHALYTVPKRLIAVGGAGGGQGSEPLSLSNSPYCRTPHPQRPNNKPLKEAQKNSMHQRARDPDLLILASHPEHQNFKNQEPLTCKCLMQSFCSARELCPKVHHTYLILSLDASESAAVRDLHQKHRPGRTH